MSDYVNDPAHLDVMDWGDLEDVINWAAAEDGAAQVEETKTRISPVPVADNLDLFEAVIELPDFDFFSYSLPRQDYILAGQTGQAWDEWITTPQSHSVVVYAGVEDSSITGVEPILKRLPASSSTRRRRSIGGTTRARLGSKRRFYCTNVHCGFEGSFPRQYELDRHIRAKHSSDKPFKCPFPECNVRDGFARFARSDKLTAHIRTVHGHQLEQKLVCPADDCSVELDLQLLNLHINGRHSKPCKQSALLRAVATAGSTRYTGCQASICSRWMPLQDVAAHLLTHAYSNPAMFARQIYPKYYTLVDSQGLAATHVAQIEKMCKLKIATSIAVVCPVCKLPCNDHASLEAHFDESHVIAIQHQDHFRAWRQYAQTSQVLKDNRTVKPWMSWKLTKDWNNVQCPFCNFYQEKITVNRASTTLEVDHHLHMLADCQEIEPHARAVLMLYPDFGSHPTWNNLA